MTNIVLYPGDGFIAMNPPPYPIRGIQIHGFPPYLGPLLLAWGKERFVFGDSYCVDFSAPRNFYEEKPLLLEVEMVQVAPILTPIRIEWIK